MPSTQRAISSTNSALGPNANPDEDWTKVSDLAERRRIQNRIAQRNYRKKMKKRIEDLERRVSPTESPEPVVRQSSTRSTAGSQSTSRSSRNRTQSDSSPQSGDHKELFTQPRSMPTPPPSELAMAFASPEPHAAPLYSQPQAYNTDIYSLPSPGRPTVYMYASTSIESTHHNLPMAKQEDFDTFTTCSRSLPTPGDVDGFAQQQHPYLGYSTQIFLVQEYRVGELYISPLTCPSSSDYFGFGCYNNASNFDFGVDDTDFDSTSSSLTTQSSPSVHFDMFPPTPESTYDDYVAPLQSLDEYADSMPFFFL